MNILTIDTATDFELISVTTEGKTYQFAQNVKMSHSVTMFDSINSKLNEASITIKDLDLVGVGIGPGSFTGVRIAVSTARMIAQILDIPLVGVTTQEIFASSVSNDPAEKILVAFDAKKSRVFAALFGGGEGPAHDTLINSGDYSMEFILDSLSGGDRLLCIGDGCARYSETIAAASASSGFSYRLVEEFIPSGDLTSRFVLDRYKVSPDRYRFYGNTTPFYARKSDAEIALDARSRGKG